MDQGVFGVAVALRRSPVGRKQDMGQHRKRSSEYSSLWSRQRSPQDDPANATDTHGRFLSFRHADTSPEESELTKYTVSPNLTMDDASPYILTHTPSSFQRMIETNYSYGFETNEEVLKENDRDHRKVSARAGWEGRADVSGRTH